MYTGQTMQSETHFGTCLFVDSMDAFAMFLEHPAPAERRRTMVARKLSQLLMHGQMMHLTMTLLLKPRMAHMALKRPPPLMHGPHVLVQVKLLRKRRAALSACKALPLLHHARRRRRADALALADGGYHGRGSAKGERQGERQRGGQR